MSNSPLPGLDIRATAVIDGVITNRVFMRRVRKPAVVKVLKRDLPSPPPRPRKRPMPSPAKPSAPAVVRQQKQPKARDLVVTRGVVGVKLVCISLPPGELRAIDEAAKKLGMNRSAFLREAARRIAKSLP